jgi:hypothetical protein
VFARGEIDTKERERVLREIKEGLMAGLGQ